MPKPLTYNATLVAREDLTPQLTIFKIRPDEPIPEDSFVPGQYVTLGMNNERVPELGSVRRPMSIASAPEERDAMEFYIRYVTYPESDNPLTHLLWETKADDRLFLRDRAVGKFTVRDTVGDDDRRLRVCVAAGTGLAPFVSMVRSLHMADPEANLGQYAILHGASYPADLGYMTELASLKASGLHYMTSISRPAESPDWQGDVGRVEDYFLAEVPSQTLGDLELEGGEGELVHTLEHLAVQADAEARVVDPLAGGGEEHRQDLVAQVAVSVLGEGDAVELLTAGALFLGAVAEGLEDEAIGHRLLLEDRQGR